MGGGWRFHHIFRANLFVQIKNRGGSQYYCGEGVYLYRGGMGTNISDGERCRVIFCVQLFVLFLHIQNKKKPYISLGENPSLKIPGLVSP